MRTTVTIDDDLYERALQVADPGMDKADMFREVFRANRGQKNRGQIQIYRFAAPFDFADPRMAIEIDLKALRQLN